MRKFLSLFVVSLNACGSQEVVFKQGPEGAQGASGAQGESGEDGSDGANGSSCSTYPIFKGLRVVCTDGTESFVQGSKSGISVTASRTYGPSTFSNGTVKVVKNGLYKMLPEYTVNQGNAGTGWLSVIMHNGEKLCFQGKAPNSSSVNKVFSFKYKKLTGTESTECFNLAGTIDGLMDSHAEFDLVYGAGISLMEGDQIKATVNGGGCGSLCQTTEVSVTLRLF